MLRQRTASATFRTLAAFWFAFATLFGHNFHLHEHRAEGPCCAPAEHEHCACESTSIFESLAHHAPTATHEDACPACVYWSHSQLSARKAFTVSIARITPLRPLEIPIVVAQSAPHVFDSRGPPCFLPVA